MGKAFHWITAPIEGFLGSVVQAGHADFYREAAYLSNDIICILITYKL